MDVDVDIYIDIYYIYIYKVLERANHLHSGSVGRQDGCYFVSDPFLWPGVGS
jgi:hypothetical protein